MIKSGRRHGNGYHGNVYQRIEVSLSERTKALLDYELDQLQKHGNIIYERDYEPEWIKRSCLKCFMTLMERRDDGIWECPKCHMKKIPKDIWNSEK